jgi:hypothetical protein
MNPPPPKESRVKPEKLAVDAMKAAIDQRNRNELKRLAAAFHPQWEALCMKGYCGHDESKMQQLLNDTGEWPPKSAAARRQAKSKVKEVDEQPELFR